MKKKDTNSKDAMKKKDTNPKDALGTAKVPMHVLPGGVLMEMGLAMMAGGRKYGTHNYRVMGVRASVYYDATLRHLLDWWEGEDIDSDSGLSHIIQAMSSLIVLRDSMLMKNWEDDRPPQLPNKLDIAELNKKAAEIIEKYPDSVTPFIQLDSVASEEVTSCCPLCGCTNYTLKDQLGTGCRVCTACNQEWYTDVTYF